jgi:hypothetical protein
MPGFHFQVSRVFYIAYIWFEGYGSGITVVFLSP